MLHGIRNDMAFSVNSNGWNINRKAVCLWTMLMLDETASIKTLFDIKDTEKCYQFI